VEWVETTGRTVEEAKDAALDQLGVDEQDAEFEVLEEPKSGLFGRLRQEARVRARVQPTRPRPKLERRDRRKRGERSERNGGGNGRSSEAPAPKKAAPAPAAPKTTGAKPMQDLDLDAQAALVRAFLEGLVDAFDVEGTVRLDLVDEETIEAHVDGADLGLLIGPKGNTLQAIQELARAILQKDGPGGARLRVDVGGYRERRKEALERFTRQVAEQVLASGTATSLEPMSPADRKVVHDTVNEIDGIRTTSEGEEPRRRVVILPE
jgi:spoIIIJ-associated protein